MKYQAPIWLPSGHLQTIYPAVCMRKPPVRFRRERWDTPDGDFIDVDFVDGPPDRPFVVLFHDKSYFARHFLKPAHELGGVHGMAENTGTLLGAEARGIQLGERLNLRVSVFL